jgi:hypothetical protein
MRFSLTSMFRLVVLLAFVAVTVSVALGRLEPADIHYRLAAPAPYASLNGFAFGSSVGPQHFIDLRTGDTRRFAFPKDDHLDNGSCSPWQDEEGQYQFVSRWVRHGGPQGRAVSEEFGLARFLLPSGRALDRIPLEVVPASRPCWSPSGAASVIYAGTDGHLYRLDFEQPSHAPVDDPSPLAITWRCALPGPGLTIRDPVWSTDPRLKGRLVVSLQYERDKDDESLLASRLWWVSLGDDGRSIVGSGPLTDPGEGWLRRGRPEERYANLEATPEGGLVMAYLAQPAGHRNWYLRLAPVGFDGPDGSPVVLTSAARTLSDGQHSQVPSFSNDGRWLFGLIGQDEGLPRVVRFPAIAAEAVVGAAVRANGG